MTGSNLRGQREKGRAEHVKPVFEDSYLTLGVEWGCQRWSDWIYVWIDADGSYKYSIKRGGYNPETDRELLVTFKMKRGMVRPGFLVSGFGHWKRKWEMSKSNKTRKLNARDKVQEGKEKRLKEMEMWGHQERSGGSNCWWRSPGRQKTTSPSFWWSKIITWEQSWTR